LTAGLRVEVAALDKDLPLTNIRTMTQYLSASVAPQRFNMVLLGDFAAVAISLAAVGIYGLLSYSVTQRTNELGIRMALGAQRVDLFKLVVGQGMRLTLLGIAVGLAASLVLTRFLSGLLFGISSTDPLTFAGIVLLFIVVALVACYVPARRAANVDPMVALRCE
jgi:putative ABC transport system permease protein